MRNAGLDEAQAGIKIARRNINDLRYADDTTLIAESEEELSVVFLYFFALIAEEGFLISSCYSLELFIHMLISFLFSFAFRFSSFHSYL